MTSAAVAAATKQLPRPRAIDGVVDNDVMTRTLVVSRPRDITGYAAFLWRSAHEALTNEVNRGWATNLPPWALDANRAPTVWCSTSDNRQIVAGTPGEKLTLRFHFPTGTPAAKVYTELVSKPRLAAIVTVDLNSHWFLGVRFLHRP